jgi:cell surface protein SprA
LPISNRKTTTIDFDEKINANITGSVGDKMKMNLNYNTDATFDYDAQNMKLKYEGKEDEIIKLVEAGNVSFPSNSSLIQGASSLFGVRADFQFGKLKLQTVLSQKKSASTSVSSKGGVQLKPFEISVANYEENRHFFLANYFYSIYDNAMSKLPTVYSGITMNRIEIWVTNKSGSTNNTRDIVAFADLGDNGYTTEEEKLVNETRKILRDPNIAITATVCRVPVTGGHSEAVNVETLRPFEIKEVRRLLENMPGVVVQDDPANNFYPMAITSFDKDEVFVGRIRRDYSVENGMNLWVVSDNIRKGAATNAVQIAKHLIETNLVN